MRYTFSRVLQTAYPVAIALAASILAWTSSVQSNSVALSQNLPSSSPDFSFQRSLASVDTSCSLNDLFMYTDTRSCLRASGNPGFFDDGSRDKAGLEDISPDINAQD